MEGVGQRLPYAGSPDLGSSPALPLRGVSSVSKGGALFLQVTVTILSLEGSPACLASTRAPAVHLA